MEEVHGTCASDDCWSRDRGLANPGVEAVAPKKTDLSSSKPQHYVTLAIKDVEAVRGASYANHSDLGNLLPSPCSCFPLSYGHQCLWRRGK